MSEIVKAFNERHSTRSAEAVIVRFEEIKHEILDDDLSEMLRKNPPDVVYPAFETTFFKGSTHMFQRAKEMQNIVLSDKEIRSTVTHHFFNCTMREDRLDA